MFACGARAEPVRVRLSEACARGLSYREGVCRRAAAGGGQPLALALLKLKSNWNLAALLLFRRARDRVVRVRLYRELVCGEHDTLTETREFSQFEKKIAMGLAFV